MRFFGAALKGLTLLGLVTGAASAPPCKPAPQDPDYHWVPTWTSMPQMIEPKNLAPVPFVRHSPPPWPAVRDWGK